MKTIQLSESLVLERGGVIPDLQVAFHTYGTLNEAKDNVIWVCHALTANSAVADWWSGIFGEGNLLDPEKSFIVCANVIGSCYGSTGPDSPGKNKRPLLDRFPDITIRDIVQGHRLLANQLGIEQIKILIGASLGGQQALEWAVTETDRIDQLILIATNASHSAFGRAFNESQRLALKADPTFGEGIKGGKVGLIAARSIAMLSYRSYDGFALTQSEAQSDWPEGNDWKAASYQRYQGEKLANRFSSYAYYTLTKAMDSHDVGRNRGGVEAALSLVRAKTLVIGISSDILFPVKEQKFIAEHILNSQYAEIDSDFGHDGFLIEANQLKDKINAFLNSKNESRKPLVKTSLKKSKVEPLNAKI